MRVGALVEEPKFLDYLTGRENLCVMASVREPEAHGRIDGVRDDGAASSTDGGAEARTGHGLIGMRERVALYKGELLAGPRAGGGFEVRARFRLVPEAR